MGYKTNGFKPVYHFVVPDVHEVLSSYVLADGMDIVIDLQKSSGKLQERFYYSSVWRTNDKIQNTS